MAKKKTGSRRSVSQKQIRWWVSLFIVIILYFLQQQGKPVSAEDNTGTQADFEDISIASVYDGDTFKINLNCSLAVYCEKVPVRVRGVDTPEIKGKTAREKDLAQKAKSFTKNFLANGPISLSHCGRDKYFRLLCDVTNAEGKNLAQELIKHKLGYAYDGGKKSTQFQ